jgi:fatty acid desaturase
MTLLEDSPPGARATMVRTVRRAVSTGGLTRTSGVRSLARGFGIAAAPVPTAAAVLVTGGWWAWLLHVVVATVALCTLPSVYHEATHRNLSRSRVLNDGVGTVAALLHLVPFETWRYFHLTHHANTGTDDDSEVYPARWSRWTLLTFPLTQWVFVYLLWRWTLSSLRGTGPRWVHSARQINGVRANTALTVAGFAVIATATVLDPRTVGLLLVPCGLSLMVSSFTLVPEHYPAHRIGPGAPDQLDRTASFHSNPVVRLLMWNSNYHAAHHFAPKVPAHHLPRVDEMISGLQDDTWRWTGYGSWYATRLRELPWRLARSDDAPRGD